MNDSSPRWFRTLLRVGWYILALNSLWTVGWAIIISWQLSFEPPPRLQQIFTHSWVTPDLYFGVNLVAILTIFGCFFVVALLLFLRLPKDRMAFFTSIFLLGFGAANAYPLAPEFMEMAYNPHQYYISIPTLMSNWLGWPLLGFFFALYPDGIFVPKWGRYTAIYCFLISMSWGLFPKLFSAPQGWMAVFVIVSVLIVFGGALLTQFIRYRTHSNPLQRQQTKWMVYGFAGVTVFTIFQQSLSGAVAFAFDTHMSQSIFVEWFYLLIALTYIMIPISVGIAILRYRLWDIDLIIRRTLQYSVVTGLLVLVYFGSIILFQSLFSTFGQQSEVFIVITTLGIAALFNPLRRRVQDFIDRRFYRKKYNAEQALAQFATVARDEVDMDRLTTAVIGVVEETMQPERVSLWLVPTNSQRHKSNV
ncbi:MAG TPA: hypothetical protein PK530_05990 [Anaerolineales bacterium]|nr:hypothetical protein [Anaerolineales bacterium]